MNMQHCFSVDVKRVPYTFGDNYIEDHEKEKVEKIFKGLEYLSDNNDYIVFTLDLGNTIASIVCHSYEEFCEMTTLENLRILGLLRSREITEDRLETFIGALKEVIALNKKSREVPQGLFDTSKYMPCPGDFNLDAFLDFLGIPVEYRNLQHISIEENQETRWIRNQEELESFEKEYK